MAWEVATNLELALHFVASSIIIKFAIDTHDCVYTGLVLAVHQPALNVESTL